MYIALMKEVTGDVILERMRNARALLVYYSTPDCSVCKVLRPKVEELLTGWPEVDFLYVDTTRFPAAAAQHLVFAVPTLLLMKNGREVRRFGRTVSMDELRSTLDVSAAGKDS